MKKKSLLLLSLFFSFHLIAVEANSLKLDSVAASSRTPRSPIEVSIDLSIRHQTIQGWGGSLCWWANVIGKYPNSSIKTVCDWITDPVNGLNMNIFRFNIGGGENSTHTHMRPDGGDMPGYKASATMPYDWSQDSAQRKVLKQLIASRIEKIGTNDIKLVAFSNSPPWWMTISGCAAGSTDGSDNLKTDMYDDFADYLTDVVKHYRDSLGITFNYIEPFNEPDANWWKTTGNQEGCSFSEANQLIMIRELYAKMAAKNMLAYTQITANDANSLDAGYKACNAYKTAGDILPKISLISVHSYAGSQRTAISDFAKDNSLNLWQSESGPLWVKGNNEALLMTMSDRIITDLRELKCTAWIDWQLVADKSVLWGLAVGDYAKKTVEKGISFNIRAQYSRYLKAGYTLIYNSASNVLTAINPEATELVIIISNKELTTQKFNIDLSKFSISGQAKQITTRANTSYLVQNLENMIRITENSFTYDASAESITTFVIPVNQQKK